MGGQAQAPDTDPNANAQAIPLLSAADALKAGNAAALVEIAGSRYIFTAEEYAALTQLSAAEQLSILLYAIGYESTAATLGVELSPAAQTLWERVVLRRAAMTDAEIAALAEKAAALFLIREQTINGMAQTQLSFSISVQIQEINAAISIVLTVPAR